MSLTVKLNDLVDAIDSAIEEHIYYLDKRTGEIILLTSEELTAAIPSPTIPIGNVGQF